jgi:hypothetical protein
MPFSRHEGSHKDDELIHIDLAAAVTVHLRHEIKKDISVHVS